MNIQIHNLVVSGVHGLTEKERTAPQRFRVDIDVNFPSELSAGDDISKTLDYRVLKNIVVEIIGGESCLLIESLAEKIADKVVRLKGVSSVQVCVAKIDIWEDGVPSVTVTRSSKAKGIFRWLKIQNR